MKNSIVRIFLITSFSVILGCLGENSNPPPNLDVKAAVELKKAVFLSTKQFIMDTLIKGDPTWRLEDVEQAKIFIQIGSDQNLHYEFVVNNDKKPLDKDFTESRFAAEVGPDDNTWDAIARDTKNIVSWYVVIRFIDNSYALISQVKKISNSSVKNEQILNTDYELVSGDNFIAWFRLLEKRLPKYTGNNDEQIDENGNFVSLTRREQL